MGCHGVGILCVFLYFVTLHLKIDSPEQALRTTRAYLLDRVVKSVISEHHRLKFNISRKIRKTYWILNISAEDENLEGEKEETENNNIHHMRSLIGNAYVALGTYICTSIRIFSINRVKWIGDYQSQEEINSRV